MTSFIVTLDTTAPTVTWGAVDGAVGGEELTVFYMVDEPGVVSATATLLDGRALAMTVWSDRLTVMLPDDTPDGNVTISALTRDALLNSRTSTVAVYVAGEIGPHPPPPPAVGLPSPPARQRHVVTGFGRTHGRLGAAYEQTTVWLSTTRARLSSRYILPTRRVRTRWSGMTLASQHTVRARVSRMETGKLQASFTTRKRPEGPGAEDELILLDLL